MVITRIKYHFAVFLVSTWTKRTNYCCMPILYPLGATTSVRYYEGTLNERWPLAYIITNADGFGVKGPFGVVTLDIPPAATWLSNVFEAKYHYGTYTNAIGGQWSLLKCQRTLPVFFIFINVHFSNYLGEFQVL